MSKIISIATAVDLDRLKNEIELYEYETDNRNPYVFMNYDTINTVENQVLGSVVNYPNFDSSNRALAIKKSNGLISSYRGYKIFRDDTLAFGEVEIR